MGRPQGPLLPQIYFFSSLSVNRTSTNTARTELHSMITFHHVNTHGSRAGRLRIAHQCVPKTLIIHVLCLFPCRTCLFTTSTSSLSPTSPIFPTISPAHIRSMVLDPHLPSDVPRQSGGSTQIPSLTGCEPKVIESEDLEPRRIELDRNLGTDPYQTQEKNHWRKLPKSDR